MSTFHHANNTNVFVYIFSFMGAYFAYHTVPLDFRSLYKWPFCFLSSRSIVYFTIITNSIWKNHSYNAFFSVTNEFFLQWLKRIVNSIIMS